MRFRFADYVLDVARRELWRGSEPVALEPQVFDLLAHLIRNRDRVVSKDDLLESVWGGRIVSESTLTSRINAARKAVGDNGEAQRLIRTVPRKGFRFVVEVREGGPSQANDATVTPVQSPAVALDGVQAISDPAGGELPEPEISRLSIVVLPFANLSGDPAQQYFADGITDCLTTDLTCAMPGSYVIARTTAFTYRDKQVDAMQIGRELGVRYLLEGSVMRAGERVRVNAQLIDTATRAHLWAERCDRELTDLLTIQDEIVARIARTVGVRMINEEARRAVRRRPAGSASAMDLALRGMAVRMRNQSRETRAEALSLFHAALDVDPENLNALLGAAAEHIGVINDRVYLGDRGAADERFRLAEDFLTRATALAPADPRIAHHLGQLRRIEERFDEAIHLFKMVISANPANPNPYCQIGFTHIQAGQALQSLEWGQKALPRKNVR